MACHRNNNVIYNHVVRYAIDDELLVHVSAVLSKVLRRIEPVSLCYQMLNASEWCVSKQRQQHVQQRQSSNSAR